uniref:Uncharacterized protein n=1 Tax=Amphiprion percula TaxID=161767 RepID=A0A3P8S055_AMPPE
MLGTERVQNTDDSGQTPLHLAASEGLLDCVEMLVEAGADVLLKDSIGLMPLDFSRIWCHRTVARYQTKGTVHAKIEEEGNGGEKACSSLVQGSCGYG